MFTSEYFLDRLKKFNPEIYQKSLESIERSSKDLDFIRLDEKSFNSCPSDSIDYALMEKSDNVFVIPVDIGWSDLGTFESLRKSKTKDSNGNVFEGDIISFDTNDSYIRSSDKLVATFGISNMTIINTKDALFVSNNSSSDKVKNIVNILSDLKRSEHIHHRKVHRPWGWYDSIEKGKYFQVKRLHIYPGAKLSIQRHQKRAEHWVLISGEVVATKGDIDISMVEGDSIFIPRGEIHSLSNPNDVYAEIIEVQSGSYLGEDDIERFEDVYGRADSC